MTTTMTPGRFEGFLKALIEADASSRVAGVETYAQAGAQGPAWTRSGLKVADSSGQATFLSIVRTSAPGGDPPDLPTEHAPEP